MAEHSSRNRKRPRVKGTKPEPGFEKPAPPEATNYQHPSSPGNLETEAGAGLFESQATGRRTAQGGGRRTGGKGYPGRAAAGPARQTVHRPHPRGSEPAATSTDSGAPLSVPSDSVGPQPAAPDVPEIADPNYSAARQPHAQNAGDVRHRRRPDPGASVSAVMSRDLDYCTPQTTVEYVARMMADKDVGSIPVVDDADHRAPVGMITDRDIVVRAVAKGQDAATLRADQCMSSGVLTIHEYAPLNEAVILMEREQVRRLMVVNHNGRLVGILSQGDVAQSAPRAEAGELVSEVSEPSGERAAQRYH